MFCTRGWQQHTQWGKPQAPTWSPGGRTLLDLGRLRCGPCGETSPPLHSAVPWMPATVPPAACPPSTTSPMAPQALQAKSCFILRGTKTGQFGHHRRATPQRTACVRHLAMCSDPSHPRIGTRVHRRWIEKEKDGVRPTKSQT